MGRAKTDNIGEKRFCPSRFDTRSILPHPSAIYFLGHLIACPLVFERSPSRRERERERERFVERDGRSSAPIGG